MDKVIIIKYGELSTKKDNINYFIKVLKNNIISSLDNLDYNITYDKTRMFIYSNNLEEVIKRLKNVFGIHKFTIGYKIDNNMDTISKSSLELLKDKVFKTFKVNTKRSNKSYPLNSMEVSKKLGAYLLKNIKDIKVDVHNPDISLNVEIRYKEAYLYFEDIDGIGGYPVSVLGKGLLMLSGGIDSPVAGYLAMKRGVKIECVYFEAPPHTSIEAKNKVLELAKKLAIYNTEIKVHIINFTEIEETIYKEVPNNYLITIMRRMMYRISEILCRRNNCKIIINGESIGQVASQTLTSMNAINKVVDIPVIRPVACFDKLEIINLANKIDTYNTSILPFEDCCTIFVPKHPVINPDIRKCEEYEKLIPYQDMIYNAIKTSQVIKINPHQKDKEYEDIL